VKVHSRDGFHAASSGPRRQLTGGPVTTRPRVSQSFPPTGDPATGRPQTGSRLVVSCRVRHGERFRAFAKQQRRYPDPATTGNVDAGQAEHPARDTRRRDQRAWRGCCDRGAISPATGKPTTGAPPLSVASTGSSGDGARRLASRSASPAAGPRSLTPRRSSAPPRESSDTP